MSRVIEEMIPLNYNEFIIKYGNETKEAIIGKYGSCFNNVKKRELDRMSRQKLLELLAKHHSIEIGKIKDGEMRVQRSKAIETLFDNIDQFIENRIISKKFTCSFPDNRNITFKIPLLDELKINLCKPEIIKITYFGFSHVLKRFMTPDIREDFALLFNNHPQTIELNAYPIVTLFKSLLFDKSDDTKNIMQKTKYYNSDVESMWLMTNDGDSFRRLVMYVNNQEKTPSFTCKILDRYALNSLQQYSEDIVTSNAFNMGKLFKVVSFMDGEYLCQKKPEELYDLVYELTCKKNIDQIYGILEEKIKQLENSIKYLRLKDEFMIKSKTLSYEDTEMMMFEILRLKKLSLLPSNETSILEIESTITEYKKIANSFIKSTIKQTMEDLGTTFNRVLTGIGSSRMKINVVDKKIHIRKISPEVISVDIALRASIMHCATESHAKIIFVKDDYKKGCCYEVLARLRFLCSNIIVFTDTIAPKTLYYDEYKDNDRYYARNIN